MKSSKSRQSSRWTHFELKVLNKEEVVVEKHEMNSVLGKHDIAEIRQVYSTKLKSVKIENFRSIVGEELRIDFDSLAVIVGPNNWEHK